MDSSLLSSDARSIYENIYNDTSEIVVEQYKTNGMNAFDYENWDEAIENLEKAMELDPENYTVLDYLALSYRAKGENQKAIEIFQRIIELFPDTRRAESAEYYIQELGGADTGANGATADGADNSVNAAPVDGATDGGDTGAGAAEQSEEYQDEQYQEDEYQAEYQEDAYWDETGDEDGDWE